MVFANKQDLPGALSPEEIKEVSLFRFFLHTYLEVSLIHNFIQVLDLDSIKTHHWQIIKCSAITGENLLQGVDWLIRDIGARIFTMD